MYAVFSYVVVSVSAFIRCEKYDWNHLPIGKCFNARYRTQHTQFTKLFNLKRSGWNVRSLLTNEFNLVWTRAPKYLERKIKKKTNQLLTSILGFRNNLQRCVCCYVFEAIISSNLIMSALYLNCQTSNINMVNNIVEFYIFTYIICVYVNSGCVLCCCCVVVRYSWSSFSLLFEYYTKPSHTRLYFLLQMAFILIFTRINMENFLFTFRFA